MSASYCKLIMAGNLCRDPELRFLPNGNAVAEVSIAINRKWSDQEGNKKEEVSFFNCVSFGKTAENLNQYCKKGASILIEGRLKQETWEDKQSGQKRQAVKVIIETVHFLDTRPRGGEDQDGQRAQEPRQVRPVPRREHPADDNVDTSPQGEDANDDSVPF